MFKTLKKASSINLIIKIVQQLYGKMIVSKLESQNRLDIQLRFITCTLFASWMDKNLTLNQIQTNAQFQ